MATYPGRGMLPMVDRPVGDLGDLQGGVRVTALDERASKLTALERLAAAAALRITEMSTIRELLRVAAGHSVAA